MYAECRESFTQGRRIKNRRAWVREERLNGNLRGNIFIQKAMDVRNELPEVVIEAGTIAAL